MREALGGKDLPWSPHLEGEVPLLHCPRHHSQSRPGEGRSPSYEAADVTTV